jgi:hypothetical protein
MRVGKHSSKWIGVKLFFNFWLYSCGFRFYYSILLILRRVESPSLLCRSAHPAKQISTESQLARGAAFRPTCCGLLDHHRVLDLAAGSCSNRIKPLKETIGRKKDGMNVLYTCIRETAAYMHDGQHYSRLDEGVCWADPQLGFFYFIFEELTPRRGLYLSSPSWI